MNDITLNAYLFFKGNCREAMEFYKTVFGGELFTQTYGETMGENATDENREQLMHASLKGGDADLLASDTAEASPESKKISICLTGPDEEKLRTIFNQLSDAVDVIHPLEKAFWGDTFGSVIDKYGIEWMVNIIAQKD